MRPDPTLNGERLWARVQKLAEFTAPESLWTRRAFSAEFLAARRWIEAEFREAGLHVRLDEAGNLIGRLPGLRPSTRPLITGSHCDTVVGGGRFDGIIGVLAGLEVAQTLRDSGHQLDHPLEVIDFLSEEPSDFGVSCIGSRALSGLLSAEMLGLENPAGETLAAALNQIGGVASRLTHALRGPDSTAAFVELHIEQGPVLEALNTPIGIVTNIVGIRREGVTLTGRADHAGTTPMTMRRDALVGAACVISAVNAKARALAGGDDYVVATVGRIGVMPNVPNAVPAVAQMVLEIRSTSAVILDCFARELVVACAPELATMGVDLELQSLTRSQPTACSPLVMEAVARAAAACGYPSHRLPSGAGHDAVYVAATGPMGMIFIPCLNGRSHCPEESVELSQLLDGTRVLLRTLVDLDTVIA